MDENGSDTEASSQSQRSAASPAFPAQFGAQSAESALPFSAQPEGRTRGTGLKVCTYLPPRIDAEKFQADIPAFSAQEGVQEGDKALQNSAAGKAEAAPEIDRSLPLDPNKDQYRQCIKVFSPADAPSDVVEEFLAFARNLFEQVFIAGGAAQAGDAWTCDRSVVPLESDERFLKYLQLHNYDLEAAKVRLLSDLGSGTEYRCASQFLRKPNGSDVQVGCAFFERRHKMQAETKELYGITNAHNTGRNYLSYWGDRSAKQAQNGVQQLPQRPRIDKQELRRRWQQVVDAASQSSSRSGAKPHLRDLQAVLEEAMQLPSPDNTPGDGFIEIVQQSVGRIKELVRVGRRWLAKAHDALSTYKHLNPSSDGLPSVEALQSLLASTKDLPVVVDEEAQIREIVTEATEWRTTARITLDSIAVSTAQNESDGIHQRTGAAASHLRPQVKIRSGSEPENSEVAAKIPLASVNELLLKSSELKVALAEKPELEAIFHQAMQISNQVGYFLDTATKRQRRRGKKSDISEAAQLQLEVARFPLEIPSAVHLNELIEQTQDWVVEARAVLNAKSAALKRIEELVLMGEKLPFDVSDELEQLKVKRAQARTWMERLKKSLPKANRNTRRVDDRAKPKLDLKEMQQMIDEGEQFDIQSKEFNQMQSVMVSANEWVGRVREMLETGDAAELEALNELLGEADSIPVVMEEVQLLRAQMEGIRWSEKLNKLLGRKKPTLQEAQKLLKEAQKIRNALPAGLRASNLLNIPREEEFKQAVTEAESATTKLKRYLPNGAVKPGVEVTKLRQLLEEAREKAIDLSEHFAPFEQAIQNAEEWVEEHRQMLDRMNIPITLVASPQMEIVEAVGDADGTLEGHEPLVSTEATMALETGPNQEDLSPTQLGQQQPQPSQLVLVETVQEVVESAESLPVSFPEIRALRELLNNARGWIEEAERLCPKRNLKRRGEGAQPTLAQLRSLLERGKLFAFDFSEDIQRVEQTVGGIEAWSTETATKLTEFDTRGAHLLGEAMSLVKANEFDVAFLPAVFPQAELERLPTETRDDAWTWREIKNETIAMDREMALIRKQADEFFITLPLAHQIEAHEKLLAWIHDAFSLLHFEPWGDVEAAKLEHLLNDIGQVLGDAETASRAAAFENTLLAIRERNSLGDSSDVGRVKAERNFGERNTRAATRSEVAASLQQDEDENFDDQEAGAVPNDTGEGLDQDHTDENVATGTGGGGEGEEEEPSLDDVASEAASAMDNPATEVGVRTRKKQQVSWAQVFSQGGMIEDTGARARQAETPTKARRGGVKRGEKRRRASEPLPTAAPTAPTARGGRGGRTKRSRATPAPAAAKSTPPKRPRSRQSAASSDAIAATPEKEEPEPVVYSLTPFVRVNFMTSFMDLADLFARFLRLMQIALDEASIWAGEVNQVLAAGKKMDMAEVEQLIAVANAKGFDMKEKTSLLETCERFQHWKKVAQDVLQGTQLLDYERMKDFVKEGERLGVDSDDLGELREHLKAAKIWLNKIHSTGIERGTATVEQLQDLLPEAENIKVDLSSQIKLLQNATSVFCLCRGPQSGLMIGCDSCDEWYHSACVNISKSGAERQAEYICLRCLLKAQFHTAITNVACLINRWHYPDEVQRAQDSRRQKSSRKVKKEQREKEKKETEFEALAQVVTSQAESMNLGMPPTPQTLLQSLDQEQLGQLKVMDDEAQAARARYERAVEEDQQVQAQEVFEKENSSAILAWMMKCQRVVWPQTAEDIERSHPLTSGLPPPAVAELEAECAERSLGRADDVMSVLEALKLARWTYRCLYILRIPPRLRELGVVLEDIELLSCDEKIIKQLHQLHQRGDTWKSRLRKVVQGSAKKGLDTEKLSLLLADAETIPIRTTLKGIAQAALQNQTFRRSSGGSERRIIKSSIPGIPARIDLPDTSDEDEEDGPRFMASTAHEAIWPADIHVPKGSPNSFTLHSESKARKGAQPDYSAGLDQPYHTTMLRKADSSQPHERTSRDESQQQKRSMADLIATGPTPYNIQAAEDLLLQMAQQMASKRMRYDDHVLASMIQHGYQEGAMSPELVQHFMLQQFHHPGAMGAWGDAPRSESRETTGGQSSQSSATDAKHR